MRHAGGPRVGQIALLTDRLHRPSFLSGIDARQAEERILYACTRSHNVFTLQCNLAFKKLGINPIVMSAGELESGNAGEPAKLIRQRYREASDIIKKGKLCSLFINDLDAGAPRSPHQLSCSLRRDCQWGRTVAASLYDKITVGSHRMLAMGLPACATVT